ncbi:MAG: NAD(P)/FAD-dependent oxidoreductase [Actinomycetota bacterium]
MKKALVVGAGIAGLSAASYLQRNGFDTEIFELHSSPGGLCTSWKRGDYTFDGCIHWLVGSGPSSSMHEIWKELGAGDLSYVEWDVWTVIHLSDGDTFTVYTDPDRLEAEVLRLSPADRAAARLVKESTCGWKPQDLPAEPETNFFSLLKSAKLREAFAVLYDYYVPKGLSTEALFMILSMMARRSAGYPIGGSLAFAKAIESKYLALGGMVNYGFRVDRILVESGQAVGVRGAQGDVRGDYVISAADGHDTVRRMLGDRFAHPDLQASLAEEPSGRLRRGPSVILVCLGLAHDCSTLPFSQSFPLERPLVLESGALTLTRLGIRLFSFDPTLAPPGKTAAVVHLDTRNDSHWTGLKERDPAAYAAEKQATAERVIAALDHLIPGFEGWVETVDVATPSTFIRCTNNWHGSYLGWLRSGSAPVRKTFEDLDNFYMVGQWVNPGGGLPVSAIDGRNLATMLCKREGLRFRPDGVGQN